MINEIKLYLLCILFWIQYPFVVAIVEIEYFFFPPTPMRYFPREFMGAVSNNIIHPFRYRDRLRGVIRKLHYKNIFNKHELCCGL